MPPTSTQWHTVKDNRISHGIRCARVFPFPAPSQGLPYSLESLLSVENVETVVFCHDIDKINAELARLIDRKLEARQQENEMADR